jgi:hypothetical protein
MHKTSLPFNFTSATKFIMINEIKMPTANANDVIESSDISMGHKIYVNEDNIIYETTITTGDKIVNNHKSIHKQNGSLIKLYTYYGNNNMCDESVDVGYMIDLINEIITSHNNDEQFWDVVEQGNITRSDNVIGVMINKNEKYTPKNVSCNGETVCKMLKNNTSIIPIDYLRYNDMNVYMICENDQTNRNQLTTNEDNNDHTNVDNLNNYASFLSKRKIYGHCIMFSNDNDLTNEYMLKLVNVVSSFDQKKYEKQKKEELLLMYIKMQSQNSNTT